MPRFVLLDHSIKRIGGHHVEYALRVLEEAEKHGYEPVLVTNKRFFERHSFPAHWTIVPVYTNTTYEGKHFRRSRLKTVEALLAATENPQRTGLGGIVRAVLTAPYRAYKTRRSLKRDRVFIETFARETANVYDTLNLQPGDQIFMATAGESEMLAMADYYRQHPQAAAVDLHFQFHFPLFKGRAAERIAHDTRHGEMRRAFSEIAAIPGQRVRGYSTNERAARQFNLLSDLPFEALAAPMDPAYFEPRPPRDVTRPLNLTILGKVRSNKGSQNVSTLVDDLGDEFLHAKRCRLLFQSHRVAKMAPPLRKHAKPAATPAEIAKVESPVVAVKWPLSSSEYLDTVRLTDIGLLPYETNEYFARISGVMVEFQAAGIPVIVTAGGWMADQISEPNWEHADRVLRELPALAVVPEEEWNWLESDSPAHCEVVPGKPRIFAEAEPEALISADVPRRTAVVAVPPRTSHLALSWTWRGCARRKSISKSKSPRANAHGRKLGRWVETTGRCAADEQGADRTQASVMPVPRGATTLTLEFSDAFGSDDVRVDDLTAYCLDAFAAAIGCPIGAVGLMLGDMSMLPQVVQEMICALRPLSRHGGTLLRRATGGIQHRNGHDAVAASHRAASSLGDVAIRRRVNRAGSTSL
ncbi:MAG: hypothetical protein QM811_01420 [Pirellulales bacterium]